MTLLGVNATDFITLSALPKVEAIVTNQVQGPLPASCSATGAPAPCVVTAQEAAAARAAVMQLNQIIAAAAAPYHAVMVDLFHLVDQLYVNGYAIGNRKLTTDFLGGLFSLDGIHPTNTGYAIMANEFIKAIDQVFGLNVRNANIREIAEHDPLVLNKPGWRRFR
jgi:hypothetical protein